LNYRFIIQYDGTRYDGWQRQKTTANTIQGKLEAVLSKMVGEPVEIKGAGRTDAGVHAKGQVANAHLPEGRTSVEIRNYMNQYLPEDICVMEVSEVSERFHSRLNAGEKIYQYRISTNMVKNVFEHKYIYDLNCSLDVKKMKEAAEYLSGEHDFQSFCAKKMKKSTVRRLSEIRLEQMPGELKITYRGNGFLYHMVRIMTGTLIEIGLHERIPQDMEKIIRAKERARAGAVAPAKGLTLLEIRY